MRNETEARERGFHVINGELHPGRLACAAIPCVPVATPEEQDVFDALHLHATRPESRT